MGRIKSWLFRFNPFRLAVTLALVLFCLVLYKEATRWNWGFFDAMEYKAIDLMFRARGPIPPNGQVVIAAIDEKSIQQLGQWPWPRHLQAQFIDRLFEHGAKVVAFDIVWSDVDPTSTALGAELKADFERVGLAPAEELVGEFMGPLGETAGRLSAARKMLAEAGTLAAGLQDKEAGSKVGEAVTAAGAAIKRAMPKFKAFAGNLQQTGQNLARYQEERLKLLVGTPELFRRFRSEIGLAGDDALKAKLADPLAEAGVALKEAIDGLAAIDSSGGLGGTLGAARDMLDGAEAARRRVAISVEQLGKKLDEFEKKISEESEKLLAAGSASDRELAEVLERHAGSVVLGYFLFKNEEEIGEADEEQLERGLDRIKTSKIVATKYLEGMTGSEVYGSDPFVRYLAVQAPLPVFSDSVDDYGFFNFEPDADGGLRWATLVGEVRRGEEAVPDHQRKVFPSLSLKAAALYLDVPSLGVTRGPQGIIDVQVGEITVPTNTRGQMLVNYHGPSQTFPHYSVVDVLSSAVPKDALKDKVVLVGATAIGIYDLRTTPFEAAYPGVEVHANAIDNILNEDFYQGPMWVRMIELGFILGFGIFLGFILGRLKAAWGAAVLVIVLIGYYLLDRYLFFGNGLLIKIVLPLLEMVMIFLGVYIYRYITEEREKKKVRNAFSHYLHDDVIDQLLTDQSKLSLGGERLELSVLFSDIRGFTSISEKLTAEQLVEVLNRYLTPMTELVFKYKGLLDKYIGDALMAVFGAPIHYPDHAANAARAACQMMVELKPMQKQFLDEGLPLIDIGIGINTGIMSVGNMGSTQRFDYTVMGDNVNLASRLEGINKQYKTNIIVSEYTRAALPDEEFMIRKMDIVRVKGKLEPVSIFELMKHEKPGEAEAAFIEDFETGIVRYTEQKWDEAIARFQAAEKFKSGDFACGMWVERCESFKQNPPPDDWDGVYVMTTK